MERTGSKTVLRITLLLAATSLAFALCACGSSSQTDASDSAQAAETAQTSEPEYQTFGTQSDTTSEYLLTNGTGTEITGLAIKTSTASTFGENLLGASANVTKDETFRLNYDTASADAVSGTIATGTSTTSTTGTSTTSSASSADAKALNTLYDIQVTCKDGTKIVIYGVNLADISQFEMCFGDGVGYITYTDPTSGKSVSTKDSALATKAAQDQAAAAAATAPTTETTEDTSTTSSSADDSSSTSYDDSGDNASDDSSDSSSDASSSDDSSSNSSSDDSGSDVNQSDDGCLTDPVFNF